VGTPVRAIGGGEGATVGVADRLLPLPHAAPEMITAQVAATAAARRVTLPPMPNILHAP
jgi:hypothetical protein